MPVVFAATIFATTVLQGSTVAGAFTNADKLIHVALYGGMAVLVAMAVQRPGRALSWKGALLAALISTAYGALEEFHQSFVPGRVVSLDDALANLVGAALGSGWYLLIARKWPEISMILGG